MLEDDPWLTGNDRPPNFYYNQQNILHKFCEEHNIEWTVTYPNDVIGFAEGNFMNLASAIGLYATITKEMGQDLVFPGSPAFYTRFDTFTASKLHAQFVVWAAREPRAMNQAFNVVNGDVESWMNLWPKVAAYFGVKVKPDQFVDAASKLYGEAQHESGSVSKLAEWAGVKSKQPEGEAKEGSSVMKLEPRPPIADSADKLGVQGLQITQQSQVEALVDLPTWSQREDVQAAWQKLAEREGLEKEAFDKATWTFLGFVLGRNYDVVSSMSKARAAGWTGYVDTWTSLKDVFEEYADAGILPKTK